ncbi:hypothetical protein PsAD46_05494 [Pseudovibrio sp. Ad46]|uniref:hypothetical protein n=1 Tax=Pseudovibrio sp. Ad46 TaxID=989432 RepID=UPI0007AEA754|nr:hypothetical protein [Pseudovibrio sp. Ad46]KZK75758.1 hypothetical protein PsAD46_05494 [Pseudovibrio sp. Ad46]
MLRWTILFFFFAMNVAAACPQEMFESGLKLTRKSPLFIAVLKRTTEGVVEEREDIFEPTQDKVVSVFPHALAIGKRISSQRTYSTEYVEQVSQLDDLRNLGSWTSKVVLYSGMKEIYRGAVKLSFLNMAEVKIGECVYDTWRVEDRLELEGKAPITLEKYYSPKLGVVLKTLVLSQDRETFSGVHYDTIAVANHH